MYIRATFLLLATSIYVSVQTLYDVSESVFPSGVSLLAVQESVSISAVGVGVDGGTTYVEIDVESSLVDSQFLPSTTITVISVPTTFTRSFPPALGPYLAYLTSSETFIADASGLRYSYPPSVFFGSSVTLAETCSFGANGIGTCVEQYLIGPPVTFSGSVIPYYTLATATPTPTSAPPTSAPPSTSTSRNGAASHHGFAGWSMAWLLLGILFHIL
ncbi:hypothetical protein C8R44DRAFT_737083 [Mycena epipterygia]|nr:hypothetical protein C8R44DRAFT_737083 [Mycena epipterygia]